MAVRTVQQRFEQGRAARATVPRSSHGDWSPAVDRPDPVRLLEEQNETRVPWLVPIRHARMRVSPFTFYRGSARIMAADLAATPTSGLDVQLGGDAHLSNFGAYASPERQLVFDANDFDETLRGPWEWDLKRLAASVTIAAQHLGLTLKQTRRATQEVTRSYRTAMASYADMGYLEAWYDHVTAADIRAGTGMSQYELDQRLARFTKRAQKKTSYQAVRKLTVEIDGRRRIRSDPPVLFPLSELPSGYDADTLQARALGAFEAYKDTLADDRRFLVDRYDPVDVGIKVVGVGSVGTLCLLILLDGRDESDPLFLQAKEAGESVLEEHLGASPYDNSGRRVVEGQRLSQAQSDIFLGWTAGVGPHGKHFYLRQLRDWKGSVDIEGGTPNQLRFYAGLCGETLARGHARSGDPEAIRAYAGSSDSLDRAVTAFAEAYSAQNLEDYRRFNAAIDEGRLEVADLV